jgi:hypothetical protein
VTLSRRCEKLLSKARANPGGLRFAEAGRLAACLGLELRRVRGSHHAYAAGVRFVSLQPRRDGKAQAYQVRQLLEIADEIE